MKIQNRRKFIVTTALLSTGIAASTLVQANFMKNKEKIIHYVFFWLKNPTSKEDFNKLIEGLRTLKKIETVRQTYIGMPALTEPRPVIDSSYSAAVLLFFDDLADQKTYQQHPVHQKFIKDCSQLWERILVYDTMDV